MGVLDDLIKIKTDRQEDDLLKMLDEIPVYEKLSVDEKLRDLKTSAVTRTKCPLLAGFIDGNIYETTLAGLVSNIYLQIEGQIPDVLLSSVIMTPRQQKQMEILQRGIVHVEYRDITEYNHSRFEEYIAAVFTKQTQDITTVAIIIKDSGRYIMFHGSYSANIANKSIQDAVSSQLNIKGEHGIFSMNSYSVLGNNGYRFGTYNTDQAAYDVMISPDGEMFLMSGNIVAAAHMIPSEERNELNFVKKDPKAFAETVTHIVESVVYS